MRAASIPPPGVVSGVRTQAGESGLGAPPVVGGESGEDDRGEAGEQVGTALLSGPADPGGAVGKAFAAFEGVHALSPGDVPSPKVPC